MVFLHPEYLWGLLGLTVPVIIHLFDFRKNRKVYFSDIRFLKQVKHASKKPLRLKQWLILMSRLGAIAFLVFVFAQPIIPSQKSNISQSGDQLIYLDNSLSMSIPIHVNESALDRARTLGQSVVEHMSKGQGAIVVDNDDLTGFWSPRTLKDASNKIASISLSEKPFSLKKLGLSTKEYKNRSSISEAFIISDFQRSSMGLLTNTLDTSVYYRLVPLKLQTTFNCVVDSVYRLPSNLNTEGQTKIRVIIRNTGSEEKKDMPVKVFVGNRQVSSTTTTVPAYQQTTVTFSLGTINEERSGIVQIEDYPVSFDNQFCFVLNKQQPIYVLEITGEQPSKYIHQVFGNDKLFYLEQEDWRNVDLSMLREADFIVLNQVKQPDSRFLEALKSVNSSGANVLIIPPYKPDTKVFKSLISQLQTSFFAKQKLQSPSPRAPFFNNVLESAQGTIEMPIATSVWSWGVDRSAILSFEDGRPYLSEVSDKLYIMSGPLADSLSNLQTHALFVPVMYQLAYQRSAPGNALFARTNYEFVDVEIDSIDIKDIVKLKMGDLELVPDKQKIGNKWRLTLPEGIVEQGVYQVMINNLQEGLVAFNTDSKESELQSLTKDELKEYFSGYKYSIVEGSDASQQRIGKLDKGIALWKYALSICLLFLLTEALLIRFL